MDYAPPPESIADILSDIAAQQPDLDSDVPHHLDVLPDGSETLVGGDVDRFADYVHRQGDNPYGYEGTCGLCSCEGVLRQFGVDVTEGDMVTHAIVHGMCTTEGSADMRGGTSLEDQARILGDYGVPAHTEQASSLEDLAADLEQGHGVIVGVNAGVLWDDANSYDGGQANHAVVPIGVARDPSTGQLQGFYINDSGPNESARFVDAATMADAWLNAGGGCVVTDLVHIHTSPVRAPAERTAR